LHFGSRSRRPLRFGVSLEDVDRLEAAPLKGAITPSSVLGALRVSARLCALRDDGSIAAEVQLRAAMVEVLLHTSLDATNDMDAAVLVSAVAHDQRQALGRNHSVAAAMEEAAARPSAREELPRSGCVAMAQALHASERLVLEALCSSGRAVGLLFNVHG
jgi:hypothetical protein